MNTRRLELAIWLLAVVSWAGPDAIAGEDSVADQVVDMSAWSPTRIAAHRDGFFRALRHVKVGAVLQVELPEITLTYKIVNTRVIDPSETSVLGPMNEPTITLVTCYPFYYVGSAPQRFIVRATRAAMDDEVRLARAQR
ncbi:class D sortase [Steroidobacter flavus]|uniref:Class D sortase n=1 Tax=Steroidobacter flavus TaxID=1842136 RepID=A0ABV8T102_9GAMM